MTRPDDTVVVRIRTPFTWQRMLLGIILLAVGVALLVSLQLIYGPMLLWGASILLSRSEQIVSVEQDLLVVRTTSRFFPNRTKQIGMDRVRGREFALLRFKRDAKGIDFRPVLRPRLMLFAESGTLIAAIGQALTLAEAAQAQVSLNRLLSAQGPGLRGAPEGVNATDFQFP